MCAPQSPSPADDVPPSLDGRDWREVRATLIAGGQEKLNESRAAASRAGFFAHPLAVPEEGALLASHPAFYRRGASYMTQSVIFLIKHGGTEDSIGLILNRPLAGSVAENEKEGLFGRSSNLADTPLCNQPVYLGGPHSLGSDAPVAVLHAHGADLPKSREPLSGVFTGDLNGIVQKVKDGLVSADEVRLFHGCVSWPPGALRAEVESGEWFASAGSASFATTQCIGLPTPLWYTLMTASSDITAGIARNIFGEKS
jgi:putative AlgH/UPF0301 family transcriptional regulator